MDKQIFSNQLKILMRIKMIIYNQNPFPNTLRSGRMSAVANIVVFEFWNFLPEVRQFQEPRTSTRRQADESNLRYTHPVPQPARNENRAPEIPEDHHRCCGIHRTFHFGRRQAGRSGHPGPEAVGHLAALPGVHRLHRVPAADLASGTGRAHPRSDLPGLPRNPCARRRATRSRNPCTTPWRPTRASTC